MHFAKLLTAGLLLVGLSQPLPAQEPEIIICAKAGDLGCVKKNVKKDKNSLFASGKNGDTVLIAAAARGANSIISYVAHEWPDWRTNDNGSNALHMAVAANHADTANLIIAFVKDDPDTNFERFINAKDVQNGATPLHLAAARCNAELYNYLVSQGAKTDITDFSGRTPQAVLARCKNPAKTAKQKADPQSTGESVKSKEAKASFSSDTQTAHTAQVQTKEDTLTN